ncbi:TPA: hypothetical protein RQ360_006350 [Klebsiella michiganensis]|nr:hypothetical protein [Klebsiella michiganensis]
MKNFKGLSLEPTAALENISKILEGGYLLTICSEEHSSEIGDLVIDFARRYAAEANAYALEEKK